MSKYGSGLSSGQVANMEKEEIREALNGRIRVGENESGFIYEPCEDKEQLNMVVLRAYDALYYQLQQALASGRALEKILQDASGKPNLAAYQQALMATAITDDYVYEEDEIDGE